MRQDPHVEAASAAAAGRARPAFGGPLAAVNAAIARLAMVAAVAGLLAIVGIVGWQVFGRYVLNSSPTWSESLALVLVLYVTLLAAAVGVRDAGHIGMESLLALAPPAVRDRLELVIHGLVLAFGAAMAYHGWALGRSVAPYAIPNLNVSEGVRYVPLVLSGALIALFSLEHILANLRGREVRPAWH